MPKAQVKEHEHKTFPVYVTNADDAQGIIEAIVNVFGIIDLGDDEIQNGSYTKTLNERGNQVKVRVLDSHNSSSIFKVLGKPLEIREIGREELARIAPKVLQDHPEATGGLFTRTQFSMRTEGGKEAYFQFADGMIDEWSIALDVLDSEYVKKVVGDGKSRVVRLIKQIRLWEYSPTIWGMNQATATTDVKSSESSTEEPKTAPTVPEQKQATLGTRLEADLRVSAAYHITDWFACGMIDADGMSALNAAVDTGMSVLRSSIPQALADMPLMGMYDLWSADGAATSKAGRMISGANRDKIQAAVDALQALLDASAPADMPTDAPAQTDEKAIGGASAPPVTGSQPRAASIIELADLDRDLSEITLMMEMTA